MYLKFRYLRDWKNVHAYVYAGVAVGATKHNSFGGWRVL